MLLDHKMPRFKVGCRVAVDIARRDHVRSLEQRMSGPCMQLWESSTIWQIDQCGSKFGAGGRLARR